METHTQTNKTLKILLAQKDAVRLHLINLSEIFDLSFPRLQNQDKLASVSVCVCVGGLQQRSVVVHF